MRSRIARCLASKAVVVFGAGLPLSRNENGKKPGRDGAASLAGGGPGTAAGGVGAAPGLGCGGGVGRAAVLGRRPGGRQRPFLGGCGRKGKRATYCCREDHRRAPSRHSLL